MHGIINITILILLYLGFIKHIPYIEIFIYWLFILHLIILFITPLGLVINRNEKWVIDLVKKPVIKSKLLTIIFVSISECIILVYSFHYIMAIFLIVVIGLTHIILKALKESK